MSGQEYWKRSDLVVALAMCATLISVVWIVSQALVETARLDRDAKRFEFEQRPRKLWEKEPQ